MRFPAAIEPGDEVHAYGVVVPDLPGCFSAGDTLDEALANTEEAILLHLEALLDAGETIPSPSSLEALRADRTYRGWTWAVIEADLSALSDKAVRVNITLPERLLRALDEYARRHGETRSGFIARAATAAMRDTAEASRQARKKAG